jgi:hypothetical protein
MDGGSGASRRAILRSGILAVGAVAGVLGIGGVAERLKAPGLAAAAPAGATILKLYGSGWSIAAQGLRRGDLPKRGDQVSVSGRLSLEPGAEPLGSFFANVQHLDAGEGHGPHSTVQMETHTFVLPTGTLVGIGHSIAGGESSFAIVGGTGAYSGATGSYIAAQNPFEMGGDGTAEFTLTLNSGR